MRPVLEEPLAANVTVQAPSITGSWLTKLMCLLLQMLQLVPAPEQTVFILLYYPPEQMATVFDIWQRWAPHAPDALTCELQLQGSGTAPDQQTYACNE